MFHVWQNTSAVNNFTQRELDFDKPSTDQTKVVIVYDNLAFNTKLDVAVFVQWNSLDDLLLGNFRVHWIPNIGSNLYVVYNRGYYNLKHFDFMRPKNSSGSAKLVWRFTF